MWDKSRNLEKKSWLHARDATEYQPRNMQMHNNSVNFSSVKTFGHCKKETTDGRGEGKLQAVQMSGEERRGQENNYEGGRRQVRHPGRFECG